MKQKETIRSLWMPTARLLCGFRRVAMMLLTTLLLTMTAQTALAETVSYLNASGASQSHVATPVAGSSLGTNGSETWYVVNSDVELTSALYIEGNVHLILADNTTLSVTSNDYAIYMYENSSLTIYSQSLGQNMGKLVINSNWPIRIGANSLTINGGDISVTTNDSGVYLAANGSMTINNGTVSLTGSDYGVYNDEGSLTITGGTVTITAQTPIYNVNNYTKTGGTVTLNSTSGGGTVNVISYLDASGNSQSVDATPVTGSSLGTNGSVTWYVVNSDVELTSGLNIRGTVHLILADNTTLSVTSSNYAIYMNDNSSLTIYSQSLGQNMGKLVINSNWPISIDANSLTINGGDISVTTNDSGVYLAANGSMTINNGTVSLTGSDYGVENDEGSLTITGGTVTITAQTPIYNVNNYTKTGGTVTLKDKSGNAYYKVLFDANGGSDVSAALVVSGGTVSKPEDPTRDGYVFVGWYNGANAYDFSATVTGDLTLTAKWGKNIANCTATVPNPIYHSTYTHSYFYDGTWNDNHGGIEVYDGETLLTYGTDYRYKMMESLDGGNCENLNENCRVYLEGLGDYTGELYRDVVIVPATVTNESWGSLKWSLDADGNFTISGTGAMNAATTFRNYTWYNYCSYFKTITIGEGITTVAAGAFGGDSNTNPYAAVTTVNLPSTLTTIGDNAFAYCTGLTSLTIPASVTTVGANAFNQCNSLDEVYCFAAPFETWQGYETAFKTDPDDSNNKTKFYVTDADDWTTAYPTANVTYVGSTPVSYIDENGKEQSCWNYTVLRTNELPDGCSSWSELPGGWYVVKNSNTSDEDNNGVDFYRTGDIVFKGDTHLILCDGAEMSVSRDDDGTTFQSGGTLTIYGQSGGTGTLSVTNTSNNISNGIQAEVGLTINGGIIRASISSCKSYRYAINCSFGDVVINGGTVTATASGDAYAIFGNNVSILGGTVVANGTIYSENGSVTIAEGMIDCTLSGGTKRVITEGATADATTAAAVNTLLGGQEISISYSRTYTTGSGSGKASTLCLPFDFVANAADGTYATFTKVTETAGVYEVEMTAVADGATLTAGTPYMFLPKASGKLTQGNSAYTVPVDGFKAASSATDGSWQFKGTFETKTWPSGQTHLYGFAGKDYYLSSGAQIAADDIGSFRRFDYGTCAAFRCYLLAPGASAARGVSKAGSLPETLKVKLVKADGTTTAIGTMDMRTGEVEFGEDWYDLNGRRLDSQPTQHGVYIYKGKKVKK